MYKITHNDGRSEVETRESFADAADCALTEFNSNESDIGIYKDKKLIAIVRLSGLYLLAYEADYA